MINYAWIDCDNTGAEDFLGVHYNTSSGEVQNETISTEDMTKQEKKEVESGEITVAELELKYGMPF